MVKIIFSVYFKRASFNLEAAFSTALVEACQKTVACITWYVARHMILLCLMQKVAGILASWP